MRRSRRKITAVPKTPIEEYILKTAGPEGVLVFRALKELNKDSLEDDIAKKAGLSKNMTRRALYKLHLLNLVTYKRSRSKNSSWYQYYWRLDKDTLPLILLNLKKEVINKLKERLEEAKRESGCYKCPRCNQVFTLDDALKNEFRCPYCDEELEFIDKSLEIEVLTDYIRRLEEEFNSEKKMLQGS